jgi:flagellar assembly factor FliW
MGLLEFLIKQNRQFHHDDGINTFESIKSISMQQMNDVRNTYHM